MEKTKRIRITKAEAEILLSTANSICDDFEDYYGSMYKGKEYDKVLKAYISGLDKLREIINR